MAMRIRKNKPERYNPFREKLLKKEFMEQMKLLAKQNNELIEINNMEEAINFAKTNSNINEDLLEDETRRKENE